MAALFGTKRQAISKHLKNILASGELNANSVSSKMEHAAADGKKYQTLFYNLDAVISVGYRVNSNEATQFQIWATQLLKEHLVRGYTIHEKQLAKQGIKDLQQSIELLQKTLSSNELVNDMGSETIQLILNYTKTWGLLLAYDEDRLPLPTQNKTSPTSLSYEIALNTIATFRRRLAEKKEANALFGNELRHGLQAILREH